MLTLPTLPSKYGIKLRSSMLSMKSDAQNEMAEFVLDVFSMTLTILKLDIF